jgi:hypothetical protein
VIAVSPPAASDATTSTALLRVTTIFSNSSIANTTYLQAVTDINGAVLGFTDISSVLSFANVCKRLLFECCTVKGACVLASSGTVEGAHGPTLPHDAPTSNHTS